MPVKTIFIECTYFKASGEYYTNAKARYPLSWFDGYIDPKEYGQLLNKRKKLPGLENGTWDGPFVCHPQDKYPELILPW